MCFNVLNMLIMCAPRYVYKYTHFPMCVCTVHMCIICVYVSNFIFWPHATLREKNNICDFRIKGAQENILGGYLIPKNRDDAMS